MAAALALGGCTVRIELEEASEGALPYALALALEGPEGARIMSLDPWDPPQVQDASTGLWRDPEPRGPRQVLAAWAYDAGAQLLMGGLAAASVEGDGHG